MPEFIVVISDPEAKATDPVVKVHVKGEAEIEAAEEGELPTCIANPSLIEKLGARHGIITLRFRREDRKYNYTCKAETDDGLEEEAKKLGKDIVKISLEWLGEKMEAEEAEAEAFRAKTWQVVLKEPKASNLLGLRIGDTFDGGLVGLPGYRLRIKGGSDRAGFPMHPSIPGSGKHRVLLSGPPGFHPRRKGERRRKLVRGNTIGPDIVQVNTVIVYG